jgi:hypothetical protein
MFHKNRRDKSPGSAEKIEELKEIEEKGIGGSSIISGKGTELLKPLIEGMGELVSSHGFLHQ